MAFGKFSISYPCDESYRTGTVGTIPVVLENAVQVIPGVRSLGSLSATNTGYAVVWLAVWDAKPNAGSNPAASGSNNRLLECVPVAAPGWFQFSVHGGTDLRNGLWVGAYSTAALALAGGAPDAGAVMFYKCEFSASKYTPQV